MELSHTEIINRPLEDVFPLVRDEMEKIIPFLPNVERLEVISKNETGDDLLEVVNHWYAKAEMPTLLQKFINPDIFSWKDTATWNSAEKKVDYSLESFLANDLFDASGTNQFVELPDGKTQLILNCRITIYPSKVPGVPKLLAKKVTPAIEGLIEKILGPNLTSLGQGINDYYSQQ